MVYKIFGFEIAAGTKLQAWVEIGPPGYKVPVTIINGARPGKAVLITAQIHAGEYPGTPGSIRAANEIDPAKVRGQILFFHCVNLSGFRARHERYVLEDEGDLNAGYPGDAQGAVSDQIRSWFVREVFPRVDFILDLHSGSGNEPLAPCLFFPKAAAVREEALAAAKVLDVPWLIESAATTGEYSYAATRFGIPGLLLETGYGNHCQPEWIERVRRNIRLLLNHLGVCPCTDCRPRIRQVISRENIYIAAQEGDISDLWYCALAPGEEICAGQELGHFEDFFGNVHRRFFAEGDGVVFYFKSGLSVAPGENVVAYGLKRGMVEPLSEGTSIAGRELPR